MTSPSMEEATMDMEALAREALAESAATVRELRELRALLGEAEKALALAKPVIEMPISNYGSDAAVEALKAVNASLSLLREARK